MPQGLRGVIFLEKKGLAVQLVGSADSVKIPDSTHIPPISPTHPTIYTKDELTLAFLDINPIAHWHTLVIPKRHAERMEDADDESAAALGLALKRVGNVMNALAIGPDYNVLLANGRNAGQEVFHVHYHLIPRTGKSDGLGYRWKVGRLLPQAQIDEYLGKARALLGGQGKDA